MLAISKSIFANNTDNNNNNNNNSQDGCCGICSGFNTPETKNDTDKDTDKKQLPTPLINNVDPIQTNSPQQQYQFPNITNIYDENIPAIQENIPYQHVNTDEKNISGLRPVSGLDNENNSIEGKDIHEKREEITEKSIEDNNHLTEDQEEENQENIEEKNEDNIEDNEENLRNEENDNNENIENERSCDNFEEGGEGDEEEGGEGDEEEGEEEEYRNIREIEVGDTIEKGDNDPKFNNGTED